MNTLKAEKRTMDVKAKQLRRSSYVVGNVFGKEMEGTIPVKMDKMEVERLLRSCHTGSQINLDVEGKVYDALIKEIDFNPLKGQINEIEFQALVSNEKVHSTAEVVLLNREKVSEGVLQQQVEEISFKAYPSDLVDKVEIDVSGMKPGDSIKVKDLSIAKNSKIELMADPETRVVSVIEAHIEATTDDTTEA